MARVTPQVHGAEIPDFLQTVVLTLFGDQYDSREERLLLSLFRMVLVEEFETSGSDMGSFMRGNTAFTQVIAFLSLILSFFSSNYFLVLSRNNSIHH